MIGRLPAAVLAVLITTGGSAAADAASGEKSSRRCGACHGIKAGERKAGTVAGYKYSNANSESVLVAYLKAVK